MTARNIELDGASLTLADLAGLGDRDASHISLKDTARTAMTDAIKALRKVIIQKYESNLLPYKIKLDYAESALLPEIRKHALVVKQRYAAKSMTLDLRIWPHHKTRLMELLNGRR